VDIFTAASLRSPSEQEVKAEDLGFEYLYVPIPVSVPPNLSHFINDKLILLDEYYHVEKVVSVGLMTEWEAIKGNAEYWLQRWEPDIIIKRIKSLRSHTSTNQSKQ
jgi:hypothetical protein